VLKGASAKAKPARQHRIFELLPARLKEGFRREREEQARNREANAPVGGISGHILVAKSAAVGIVKHMAHPSCEGPLKRRIR
jgi:hypothetical protein